MDISTRQQQARQSHSREIVNIYQNYIDNLLENLHDPQGNKRIDKIENSIENYISNLSYHANSIAEDVINGFDESELIKSFKILYKKKGIQLRTNQKYPVTILTTKGELTIWRYILRPKCVEDYNRLLNLEGVTTIVPKDEYLGLSVLPTKLTVGAMLFTARKAQESSSYKLAEEILRNDHGLNICAATIMTVANIIGGIAFKTEREKAEESYELLSNAKLMFNKNKDGILYIETDGAMFNSRDTNDSGTTWRENKLGLVFSSDNVRKNTNRTTGEVSQKIVKKEYTSYIGEASEFKKFLFVCILRNGYGEYKNTVLISDGAKWVKNVKEELFYDAIHILDFFHLKEKVYDFGKLYYNHVEKKYKPWAEQICSLIKESKYIEAIRDIEKKQASVSKKENSLNLVSYL